MALGISSPRARRHRRRSHQKTQGRGGEGIRRHTSRWGRAPWRRTEVEAVAALGISSLRARHLRKRQGRWGEGVTTATARGGGGSRRGEPKWRRRRSTSACCAPVIAVTLLGVVTAAHTGKNGEEGENELGLEFWDRRHFVLDSIDLIHPTRVGRLTSCRRIHSTTVNGPSSDGLRAPHTKLGRMCG